MLTAAQIASISGRPLNANMQSILKGLDMAGEATGLSQPHRLACYLAQIGHETMGFTYDREIWGPTAAQKRYEGRKDLGNTQPGDGKKFMGRTGIQITGRANTHSFRVWCVEQFGGSVPDFVANPDAMNTDPWEGLGPIWYWDTRGLNRYADEGNHEMITRRINGGLNGYEDRLRWFNRAALVLLGFNPTDIRGFQTRHRLTVDGIAGPATRALMLAELKKMSGSTAAANPISGLLAMLSGIFSRKVTA